MNRLLTQFSTALLLVFMVGSAVAETMYVRSAKCKVMATPSFKAELVVRLSKGQQVEVVDTQGGWFKISSTKGDGWVSKFLLTKNAAVAERKNILKFDDKATGNIRKRASVITTAAAARGLTAKDDTTQNAELTAQPDFDALKMMDSFKPTQAEVDAFIGSISRER